MKTLYIKIYGLGHRSAQLLGLAFCAFWSAATRRRLARKAATSRRTPQAGSPL